VGSQAISNEGVPAYDRRDAGHERHMEPARRWTWSSRSDPFMVALNKMGLQWDRELRSALVD
jgi:hypothetical protein